MGFYCKAAHILYTGLFSLSFIHPTSKLHIHKPIQIVSTLTLFHATLVLFIVRVVGHNQMIGTLYACKSSLTEVACCILYERMAFIQGAE